MAARALCDIARGNAEMRAAIAEEGAIGPLVTMLSSRLHAEGQKWAAAALAALAEESERNQGLVAEAGAIPPLVALLSAPRLGVREHAVGALRQLASGHAANQVAIGAAGAVNPLVALIRQPDESPEEAAAALESISRGCADNQVAFAAAGAIPPLVSLLSFGSSAIQGYALAALLSLSMPQTPEGRDAVIAALVGALQSALNGGPRSKALLKIAEALAALVVRSTAERLAVEKAGAVKPLVTLLGDGHGEPGPAQQAAAGVLAELVRTQESRRAAVAAGGVAPLVAMLQSAAVDTRAAAAGALARLATSREASSTIGAVGIEPLVILLKETGDGVAEANARRHAASTLWYLVADEANAGAAVALGAVTSLVTMLVWPTSKVTMAKGGAARPTKPSQELFLGQEAAAAVAAELTQADGQVGLDAQSAIVQTQGVFALKSLLEERSGCTPMAKRHAACALWHLAAGSAAQQVVDSGAIPALVGALGTSEAQGFAAAALCCVARADARAKAAIVQAGGVSPLYTLAHAPSAFVRAHAADVINLVGHVPAAGSLPAGAASESGGMGLGAAAFGVATTRRQRRTLQKPTAPAAAPSAEPPIDPPPAVAAGGLKPTKSTGAASVLSQPPPPTPRTKAALTAFAVPKQAKQRLCSPLMKFHVVTVPSPRSSPRAPAPGV